MEDVAYDYKNVYPTPEPIHIWATDNNYVHICS